MFIYKKIGKTIKSIIYAPGVNPLPTKIIASLFLVLLFSSMTMTMAFAFIPQLVKSFGNSEVDTGYKVGILGGALFVGRIISSFLWGWAADRFGRKRFAIISSILLGTATLGFGFTFNYSWAVVTRLMQGLSMGLVVIGKAMIGEYSDNTNQNVGMTFLIGAFSIGLVIGPSIGGFLAFPDDQYPNSFSEDNIFSKFGVLLPCLIVTCGIYIGSVILWIAIPTSKKSTTGVPNYDDAAPDEVIINENTRLLDVENDIGRYKIKMIVWENNTLQEIKIPRRRKSMIAAIFRNKPCVLSCLMNGFLSFTQVGFSEVFPLYAATSKEFKGYGFRTFEIGSTLMINAGIAILIQFTVLSRLMDKFGLMRVLKYFCLFQALVLPIVPLCHYIENRYAFWTVLILATTIIRISSLANFVIVNIFVNNSVHRKYLASANGISMTVATLARSISVPVFGLLYSWSLTNIKSIEENVNPIGFPFNQYFIFFIFSLMKILIILFACILPSSLEKKYEDIGEELNRRGNQET